ncbi:hypothetical protein [Shewanella sp.]|uniref:hypothetical protein n=1 Tax=Shewanella sp. TaxID=50422 RepID=UPI003A96E196
MIHSYLALLASGGMWLMTNAQAAVNPSVTGDIPMVLSYAVQPVHHFNQQLQQATRAKASWTTSPESISQHFVGKDYELIKAQEHNGNVITYNLRPSTDQHPQLLLILSLDKHRQGWKVSKAGLSWRCQNDNFYGTNNCQLTKPQP